MKTNLITTAILSSLFAAAPVMAQTLPGMDTTIRTVTVKTPGITPASGSVPLPPVHFPTSLAPAPKGSTFAANPENNVWAGSVNGALADHTIALTTLDSNVKEVFKIADNAQNQANTAIKNTEILDTQLQKTDSTANTALANAAKNTTDITGLRKDVDANTAEIAKKVDTSTYNTDKAAQAAIDQHQDTGIAEAIKDAGDAQKTADDNTKILATKVDTSVFTADQQRQDAMTQQNTTAIAGKVDQQTYQNDKVRQLSIDSQQDTAIAGKVDQSTFTTDQQRQDDALKTTQADVSKNTAAIATNTQGVADNKAATDALKTKIDDKTFGLDATHHMAFQNQQNISTMGMDISDLQDADKDLQKGIDANKADLAKKVDQTVYDAGVQRQNSINSAINRKNNDQDTAITGLRTDVDTNKQGVADNKAALATKVDTSTFTTDQQRQDDALKAEQTRADTAEKQNAAEIANNKVNINHVNDAVIKETADRQAGDAGLQTQIDTKADKTTVQGLVDDAKVQDKAIADNARDINVNRLTNTRQQTAIDDNTKAIAGKVDAVKQAAYDTTQDLGIAEATQDALAAQNTADRNTKALNDKVDNSAFHADQQRQDGLLQQEVTDRTNADDQLRTAINTKADAGQVAANKLAIDKEVKDEATHYQTLTTGLSTKVDQVKQDGVDSKQDHGISEAIQDASDAQKTADTNTGNITTNSDHIDTVEKTEAKHFNTLTSGLSQKVESSTFSQRSAVVDQRLADAKAERAATNATVARHTSELANHEQRISELEKNTNANFSDLKKEVDSNRHRASAAISGVAAMANIPQVIESQTFNVGAGVGTTDGESAVAVGFSARATEHVVVKASVSTDTQHNFVVGGGVSYGW
ncbi:YadA-like family protein [Citrobacter portucalensis]|uniref:YadA-like family protein n=1 Tax=Citrobacter portucalensis TaxID=1639133 RepID=UPI00226B10FD|nr:YadA-like family protein [Citrobacter portucalensis]MCX8980099.1 YadA-like family protein [Citrobacter portucalensis]